MKVRRSPFLLQRMRARTRLGDGATNLDIGVSKARTHALNPAATLVVPGFTYLRDE
jgi:hypothetical protein